MQNKQSSEKNRQWRAITTKDPKKLGTLCTCTHMMLFFQLSTDVCSINQFFSHSYEVWRQDKNLFLCWWCDNFFRYSDRKTWVRKRSIFVDREDSWLKIQRGPIITQVTKLDYELDIRPFSIAVGENSDQY